MELEGTSTKQTKDSRAIFSYGRLSKKTYCFIFTRDLY
jgi:hypothetical protein